LAKIATSKIEAQERGAKEMQEIADEQQKINAQVLAAS